MAAVHIPAPLRSVTNGETVVYADGVTLGEIIDQLEDRYPGIRARLVEDGRLRRGMAAFVDGVQVTTGLATKAHPGSEIYLSPAISGG